MSEHEPFEPAASDEAVTDATGHGFDHWLPLLDRWGALDRSHTETARHLVDDHGVPGWWAQSITVTYERARGLRAVGQRRGGGFEATASKTVHVPVEVLYAAVVDPAERRRWLPDSTMTERTATPHRSARFDWEDGSSRALFGFDAKGPGRSVVSVQHEKLPDAAAAGAMKAHWRAALATLKDELERQR